MVRGDEVNQEEASQSACGLSAKALKLRCWKVRFRGVPNTVTREIFFEKLIGCFSRHARNLYDRPEFILCDLKRYRNIIEMQVRAKSKESIMQRVKRLKRTISIPPALSWVPGEPFGYLTIAGVVTEMGGDFRLPRLDRLNNYQYDDTVFLTRGRHGVKFGFQAQRLQFNQNTVSQRP